MERQLYDALSRHDAVEEDLTKTRQELQEARAGDRHACVYI